MATVQDDIPLTPVDDTPAVLAAGKCASWAALTPPRVLLLLAGASALLIAPWLAQGQTDQIADPQLANLLRFMGVVKLVLVLAVAVAAWWRLGGQLDLSRTLAYVAAIAFLLACALFMLMLYRVPQAAAAYHGTAFALLVLAFQDREIPNLLIR